MNAAEASRLADTLAPPPYRHRPGATARHDEASFEAAKALLPALTRDADAAVHVPWRYGVRLFNERFHWEAHEILEAVWWRAPPNSRERHLVRAVIQLANGELKLAMGRGRAAARLGALAREAAGAALRGKEDRLMGLSGAALDAAGLRLLGGPDGRAGFESLLLHFSARNGGGSAD